MAEAKSFRPCADLVVEARVLAEGIRLLAQGLDAVHALHDGLVLLGLVELGGARETRAEARGLVVPAFLADG